MNDPPRFAPATDRRQRLPLAGWFVFMLFAVAVAIWYAPAGIAWFLSGALLSALAVVIWLLRRGAAEKRALQARLDRQVDRLQQFAEAQSEFVDGIAHQIKTPLTIVLNHAELMMHSYDDPVALRTHGKSLVDYTMHHSGLLEGFLRLGGPFAVTDTSQHVPVQVNDLVVDVVRRCQSIARSRAVDVVLTIADPGSDEVVLEVLGNQALLAAMSESLVRRAVSCSPRGSRVEVQVGMQGESVMMYVRDQGPVIAPSELDSVFDWFGSKLGSERQPTGDCGGVAIGGRIAEHHHGTIAVRNLGAGGCEFVVTLPRLGKAQTLTGTAASEATPTSEASDRMVGGGPRS